VDSNRQNAGRSPDEDEGRCVKPDQPSEDGNLEEAGIKENLEDRQRRGESVNKNSRPHVPDFFRTGGKSQSQLQSTNNSSEPTEMGE